MAIEIKTTAVDPSEELSDVGCQLEQTMAALAAMSNAIHEVWDGHLALGEVPKRLSDYLYQQWLMLEIIRRDLKATNRQFGEVESILCRAGRLALLDNEPAAGGES